jgi:hypothetical protein
VAGVSDREQFPNLSQVYGGGVPIALTGDIPHAEWPEDMPIRDIIQVLHDLVLYMDSDPEGFYSYDYSTAQRVLKWSAAYLGIRE